MDTKANAAAAGTITIGGTLTVNRMGFGGMRLCGPGIWGWPEDRENALRVLRRAVELGVNFIDTADSYGPEVNEEQIAQALYPYPDGLVIATKGGLTRPAPSQWVRDGRPERLKKCCEASLRRLKLDRIDIYQLHAPDEEYPLEDMIGALVELRDEGKIRFIGVSNFALEQVQQARGITEIVSVQNPYNYGERRNNDNVLDYCEREGLAFLPYFPLGAGDISGNADLEAVAKKHDATVFQIALAWLLHRSKATLPIPGTQSLAHLEENVAAADITFDEDDLTRLALR
jgi:aryl-alcohol dehydrogenase-like predicted oxidoreductase